MSFVPGAPFSLEIDVPSCSGAFDLIQKINAIENAHQSDSHVTYREIQPTIALDQPSLLRCAVDANKAGYKDAAFYVARKYAIQNLLMGAANETTLQKVLNSIPPRTPFTISVPAQPLRHCTATSINLGFEKKVDVDCY